MRRQASGVWNRIKSLIKIMVAVTSNFGDLSQIESSVGEIDVKVQSMESAIYRAGVAFDNVAYSDLSMVWSYSSTYISGGFGNGDYVSVFGSGLTGSAYSITSLQYSFFSGPTVSLYGSVSGSAYYPYVKGYISKIVFSDAGATTTITGKVDVSGASYATISSVSFSYGAMSLTYTGTLNVSNSYEVEFYGVIKSITLVDGDRKISLSGLSLDYSSLVGAATANDVFALALSGNDTVSGSAGDDYLQGYAGNDKLYGYAGNDILLGDQGNDLLDGGLGADRMEGGAGDDTYVIDNVDDQVIENEGEGTDNLQVRIAVAGGSYTLAANVENGTLLNAVAFSLVGNAQDNVLVGNAYANTLTGGAGNDTLDGKAGADTLIGGTGDDIYVVDNAGDVVVEEADEGIDEVRSTVSFDLSTRGANVEKLTLLGTGIINATGNELDNTLVGNAAANILDGGLGADTMEGGKGNDTYVVDDEGDVVIEYFTNAQGGGVDTVRSSITYALGGNLDNLTLTGAGHINGTGNSLNNVLTGNSGNNVC